MSNLVEHAKREFEILGWPGDCEMQQMICDNILNLLQVFSDQGHSGTTAPYTLSLFSKLAKFDAIAPLTGSDDEWAEPHGNEIYQNKRDGTVFKEGRNGEAYWIDGKIFRDKNGCTYTSKDSRVFIKFPWTKPESEIIDVED
jgi:hypothetical protein